MLPPIVPDSVLRSRYRVIEIVGQGGMGSIYRAEDTRLEGRYCAIKEILIDPQATPAEQRQVREQFYREATILARLDHTNLPKVSDFFDEDGRDFLVMDFVPGVDLHQKIREAEAAGEFIAETKALDWISQLCDALTYLHRQHPPVLHRDIKPSNIKLTPSGLIKLVDFGLVKVMIPDDRTITIVQGRGTAAYTPLEQYGGDTGHTDARSDIYSLGATLYHLLTNQAPVEAKTRFLQSGTLTPPRELNPAISPRTEQAILWALAMHPHDRPIDVQTFKELLLSTGPIEMWPRVPGRREVEQIAPFNRLLLTATIVLLLLSLVITLFAPTLVR